MKQLTEYNFGGFKFIIVDRKGNIAFSIGINKYGTKSYEVFKVKIQLPKVQTIGGKEIYFEHKEIPPKISDFGKDAFSYGEFAIADNKFKHFDS